jgi:hypothetical protein
MGVFSVDCVVMGCVVLVDCDADDELLLEIGPTSKEFAPSSMAITAMTVMTPTQARAAVLWSIVIAGILGGKFFNARFKDSSN